MVDLITAVSDVEGNSRVQLPNLFPTSLLKPEIEDLGKTIISGVPAQPMIRGLTTDIINGGSLDHHPAPKSCVS